MKKGTATILFDWLADQIIAAGVPADATFGFTFSFPVEQTAINAGSLVHWTKGFTAKGVPGQDVVRLLNEALAAKVRHPWRDAPCVDQASVSLWRALCFPNTHSHRATT